MTSAMVIGASFAGLLTAAALARSGLEVTVLERDRLDSDQRARPRSGVPQSGQPHILLRRGLMAIDALLPGIESDLLAAGGRPFNTAQMPTLGEFGWVPQTDWAYEIISIGRPILEAVVRRRVADIPGCRSSIRAGSTDCGGAGVAGGSLTRSRARSWQIY